MINSAKGALQVAGGHLSIPNLQLASNVITIGGQGSAPIDAKLLAKSGTAAPGDLQISGQINAAALARQLPATLHIRPDSRLDSGLADFTLSSQSIADGRRWAGSLKTHDFRGTAGGRPIEFDQPLQIDFSVLQSANGPVIERMIAQASFVRLEGRGSLSEGSLSAKTDLNKLVDELSQIRDWGETQLQGALAADLRWKQSPADGWNATAEARATNFKLIAPGLAPGRSPAYV